MLEVREYYTLLDMVRLGIDFNKYYIEKDYTEVNWKKVFELSKLHRVSAISFHGIDQLMKLSELAIDPDLLAKWIHNIEQQKVIDMSQRIAFQEIMNKFEKEKIDYYPFKGFMLKELYPKSYFREMTDIDFYVHEDDFKNAEMLLINSSYVKAIESNSSVLTLLKSSLVKIEIQNVFFDGDRYPIIKSFFEKELPKKHDINKSKLYWDETTVYIYLFCHLYKHLKSGGIGIRLILDLWLYQNKNQSKINWKEVHKGVKEFEIDENYQAITSLINDWFENNSYSQNKELENYILLSGLFGTTDNFITNNIKKEKNTSAYIIKRLFPSRKYLRVSYPEMSNSLLLLPYYWSKRAIRILINNNKSALYEVKVLIRRLRK